MRRFKNISLVYPCDDSTLERVVVLARENDAKVTLVQAIKNDSLGETLLQIGQKSVKLQDIIVQEHKENLAEIANSLLAKGVAVEHQLLVGDAAIEITKDVLKNGRDLVIMTAEGELGLKERIFGSTSSQLMRKCPVPLLVVKPGAGKEFKKILAAIDPVVSEPAHDTLNASILQLANAFAQGPEDELHVVHGWALLGESLILGRGGLSHAAIAEIYEVESKRRLHLLTEAVRKAEISRYIPHIAKGEAAKVIPHFIDDIGVDLLVMGTVCRTGIPGFLIGNTAESILNLVHCSVLVVKPDGFVSPVTV